MDESFPARQPVGGREFSDPTSSPIALFLRRAPSTRVVLVLIFAACKPAAHPQDTNPKRGAFFAGGPERVLLAPGLEYRRVSCDGASIAHELRLDANSALEIRVIRNPTAHRESRCLERYGGTDALSLLSDDRSFQTLAFVNGNFFHTVSDGFVSNGFLWSAGAPDGGYIAPMESTLDMDYRGDRLALVDGAGRVSDLQISTGPCSTGQCRTTMARDATEPSIADLSDVDDSTLVTAIRVAPEHFSAALQLTPALERPASCRAAGCSRRPSTYVECTTEHRWTCQPHSVTFLCVHADRTVSLIASEKALYSPLVASLAEGGACRTDCAMLYLLDGGGSTQLGFRQPQSGRLRMVYAGKYDPAPSVGCSVFRPVDHYIVVGRRAP